MEPYQIVLIVLGSLLLILLVGFFFIGKTFFKVSFSRRKDDERFAELENPEDKKTPDRIWYFSNKLEELTITSFDNLKLKGYFIDNKSDKLVILVHGYRGRYYSCVSQAHIFSDLGYDVLAINNRAHDTSEGKYFSMGPNEKKDILMWIDFMVKRNPKYQICLLGTSMGGHIVMMTGSSPSIQDNVKCIIEDCGYASLKEILVLGAKNSHILFPRFAASLGGIYARMFHHFSFRDDTKDAFKSLKLPILLIHGDLDKYVPYENLKINASNVPDEVYKEVVTFKGVDHNRSVTEYDKYKEVVSNFVSKFIK